jgi:hypothetical protein
MEDQKVPVLVFMSVRGHNTTYEIHATYVKNMELITIRNAEQA